MSPFLIFRTMCVTDEHGKSHTNRRFLTAAGSRRFNFARMRAHAARSIGLISPIRYIRCETCFTCMTQSRDVQQPKA